MTHLIYIYLIINSFIAGNYLFDDFNDDRGIKKFVIFSVLFLFGAPWILLYLSSQLPVFKWIKIEVRFLYTFYITDYWKNAIENDKDRTEEEMLKILNDFAQKSNRQSKRHNRLIQKRYANNN
jgi:hypothetical protein